jgi:hypothetical protein
LIVIAAVSLVVYALTPFRSERPPAQHVNTGPVTAHTQTSAPGSP